MLRFCYASTADSITDNLTTTVQLNAFYLRALSPIHTLVHT